MSLKDKITSTREGLLVWHQERVIFETTNLMCELMDQAGVTRTDLAKRMGRTKGYITQLLDGTANMTLRTVSDVFVALNRQFHPAESPLEPPHSQFVNLTTSHLTFSTTATDVPDATNIVTVRMPTTEVSCA